MIAECRPTACFGPFIDSVEAAVIYLNGTHTVDLIFLDVHLSDGHAFNVFEKVEVNCPVIFTTAYDQYAVKAFEVNSIDYLLKPMNKERICKALEKFDEYSGGKQSGGLDEAYIDRLHKLLSARDDYKQSFLVPYKDKLLPVPVKDFAWFEIQQSVVTGTRLDGVIHVLEERSLDELAKFLDPRQFYRANRQFLVNRVALKEVVQYFNGKLLVKMAPQPTDKIIISREKVTQFKKWVTA